MLLTLALPLINQNMTQATIDVVHAKVGDVVPVGAKLIDLTIDLGAVVPHDCAPVSTYRIVSRDRVFLRRLDLAPGDSSSVGAQLALFSTEPDEDLEATPTRALRTSIAGVIKQPAWPEF